MIQRDKHLYEIRGHEFWKWHGETAPLDYKKALALWELLGRGRFCAPRPLRIDLDQGIIVYEYLDDLKPIISVYMTYMKNSKQNDRGLHLIRSCGEALGEIHKGLDINPTTEWRAPEGFPELIHRIDGSDVQAFMKTCPKACLHSDFGFSNIAVMNQDGQDRIVVLDAVPNEYTVFEPIERGPVYVDIGLFASCLDGRVPLNCYTRIKWNRIPEIKEAFYAGYEAVTGMKVNRAWASLFARSTAHYYFHWNYPWPFGFLGENLLYNRFKGNLL